MLKRLTIILLLGCLLGCAKNYSPTESSDNHPEISVNIQFPLENYKLPEVYMSYLAEHMLEY